MTTQEVFSLSLNSCPLHQPWRCSFLEPNVGVVCNAIISTYTAGSNKLFFNIIIILSHLRRTYTRTLKYYLQLQLTTMCQTNLSSVSQTASRNYPSYVCTRLWGPIISRTGFSYILAAPIAAIFNSSVRQNYVPPSWKQAEILPIPKVSQVISLAKHLCRIALTPVLSKVLESFVVSWMRRATVHSETQFGGIRDSSTTLALITMLHHVLKRLERKNTYARILLIDFSKAFDHIDHHILLEKLKTNGVPQICVEWQKAFLTSRTQRVKLANTISEWTEVAGGVPQGTLSGPENFLNMIDDLHTDVDVVDDITLYEVCKTHSQNKLQNAVDDIQEWATDNNMSLNTNKTKELLVYFGREDLDIPRITINGGVIERVSCTKLLGCHIMSNLSWEDHIAISC